MGEEPNATRRPAPTVSVPLASRPYYRAHRRTIEQAVAAAVKSIMESEPEDPVAGLAVHFGVVATEPQPTGGGASSSESDLATRLGEEHARAFEAAVRVRTEAGIGIETAAGSRSG